MVGASGDGDGRSPWTEVDRSGGRRGRVRGGVVGRAAVAELPTGIGPPALEVAVVEDGTGVVGASGDGDGRSPWTEVDRSGGRRGRVRGGVVGRAAVAELPTGIGSPAPEVAIDVDGAGVRWSSVDLVMVTGQGGLVAGVISGAGRAVANRSHRVDGVCMLSGDRSRDLTRCGVHREAVRQRR